jgi:tRNA (guanine37-N1)-methyltransferase
MRFEVITIFPRMVASAFEEGVVARAIREGIIDLAVHDLRDYAAGRHRKVDDEPFGGGAGMVLKPEPIFAAVEAIREMGGGGPSRCILLSPQGASFDQETARRYASGGERIVLICGRYEGIDERVREHLADEEVSVGDFVLTGGEIAAMAVIDAVARLIPGTLGSGESTERESFTNGLFDHPVYTRPAEFRGMKVPDVLLSGHHADIERWRSETAAGKTMKTRPELSAPPARAARADSRKR